MDAPIDIDGHSLIRRGDDAWYAIFSECENYRYELGYIWDSSQLPLVWIGLNPSTADELALDPTLKRIGKRSKLYGAGGFIMLNLFAWRATKPADMKKQADPVGPLNDFFIKRWIKLLTVPCWGGHGGLLGRDAFVLQMLRDQDTRLLHLGTTNDGKPRHPLMLGYSVELRPWNR